MELAQRQPLQHLFEEPRIGRLGCLCSDPSEIKERLYVLGIRAVAERMNGRRYNNRCHSVQPRNGMIDRILLSTIRAPWVDLETKSIDLAV